MFIHLDIAYQQLSTSLEEKHLYVMFLYEGENTFTLFSKGLNPDSLKPLYLSIHLPEFTKRMFKFLS